MQVVIFSSPGREKMLERLLGELKGMDVHVIDDARSFGRKNFWRRWTKAKEICLASKHDNYLILPDDIHSLDLGACRKIAKENTGRIFTCNVINDGRTACWGKARRNGHTFHVNDYIIKDVNFFDCGGVTNRITIQNIQLKAMSNEWHNKRTSSGVGFQITRQLRRLNAKMYQPTPSLCFHGDHESVMHPEERKKNPLVTMKRLKKVVAIATMPGREEFLRNTIRSLAPQVDEIRIYHNGERDVDLTDNGKFYFLQEYKEPVYYFTCDDDIIYPPTYIRDMIKGIERTQGIVTLHGRKLRRLGVSYYRGGHKCFRCSGRVNKDQVIHVAGTGVTGFRTDQFNPTEIYKDPSHCMSDLIFSLAAAKAGKKITCLAHEVGYIKVQPVPNEDTIFGQHRSNDQVQSRIADEVLKIRSRTPN